jgi:hypothetical protein
MLPITCHWQSRFREIRWWGNMAIFDRIGGPSFEQLLMRIVGVLMLREVEQTAAHR